MKSDPSTQDAGLDAPLVAARSTSGSSLLIFFLLTYAVVWTCFIAAAALSSSVSAVPALWGIRSVFFLPGVFTPSPVAVGLTKRAEGDAGVHALLDRVFEWQVGMRWFVFAVGYMAAIKLTVALLHRAVTGVWPRFGDTPWYVIVVAIVISTPFQPGEEFGWSGYALPLAGDALRTCRREHPARTDLGLLGTCLSSLFAEPTRTDSHFSCTR